MLDTIGIKGVLKLMKDIKDRYCEFRSCLAFYDGNTMEFFESSSPGKISTSIRGKNTKNEWSELWYIFIPENYDKTLAEFTEEELKKRDETKEDSCMAKFGAWYELIWDLLH